MVQRMIRTMMFITIIVLAGACANAQEEAIPTLLVIPSATSTDTPTPTETPTETPPSTATMTFTPSQTPTTTPSYTPTTTATATLTWTPSVTATFTLTPSPTATATFTQSPTPTWTNTPVGPVINLFNASAAQAAPGTQVTLRWDTLSAIVRIERLDGQGTILETFGNLPATSSLVVTIPSGVQQVAYRLVANLNGVETTASVPITITCGQTWFFANPPADAGCPEGPSTQVSGAFQSFQTGFMVHLIIPSKSVNRVFGAQNDGFQYLGYQNQWDGTTIVASTPPPGFLEPQGIFNWMFFNKLASGGTWELKVGWATNNIDNSTRTVQFAQNGTMYFNTPLGVYRFNGNPAAAGTQSSGTWQKIN